jgi:hypothetical protein
MSRRSTSVESACAAPMRVSSHARGPLSRSPAALHAVIGSVGWRPAFPLRSRFVQRVLRSMRATSLRAHGSAYLHGPTRRGIGSSPAVSVHVSGWQPSIIARTGHRGYRVHSECRALAMRHSHAKLYCVMHAWPPNQRFERTAASKLAVPVSLRSPAASQARR